MLDLKSFELDVCWQWIFPGKPWGADIHLYEAWSIYMKHVFTIKVVRTLGMWWSESVQFYFQGWWSQKHSCIRGNEPAGVSTLHPTLTSRTGSSCLLLTFRQPEIYTSVFQVLKLCWTAAWRRWAVGYDQAKGRLCRIPSYWEGLCMPCKIEFVGCKIVCSSLVKSGWP